MQQDNRSYVVINIDLLISNIKLYRSINKFKRIIAIVKANAYGHGDVKVARALSEEGVDFFAVSNINEGKRLRNK